MSNSTSNLTFIEPDRESAVWIGIVFAIYALIGIPCNLLIMILTIAVESIRVVPLNICVFSIALADCMTLVSLSSSAVYAITFDVSICKVFGVGLYIFAIPSMMLPSCMAVCRHAAIGSERESNRVLRQLKRRKNVILLNAAYWTYGWVTILPFIMSDKFGMDSMGVCGIAEIDSAFYWIYYVVALSSAGFIAYGIAFVFCRKLVRWVTETSSLMTMSVHTRDTLNVTRSLLRMLKWIMLIPVVCLYPGMGVQTVLRIKPDIVSVRIARFIMYGTPLPTVANSIIILTFVKPYRYALLRLFCDRRDLMTSTVRPSISSRMISIRSSEPIIIANVENIA